MNGRRRWLRGLVACGCVPLVSATPLVRAQGAGDAAPFEWPEIVLLDGTVWRPESWRDRAAVVVLWATWCPFCHGHNPHVEKLWQAVRGGPMRVLGVSIDRDPELVRRHVRERGYTFPITLDATPLAAALSRRNLIPLTVTVDRRGLLRQVIPGEMFEEDVMELLGLAA